MKTNFVYDKESGTTVPVHLSCLQELVWLDGGHNGGPGAIYVTDQNILEKFASYNINVDVRLILFFQKTTNNKKLFFELRSLGLILFLTVNTGHC